MYEKAIKDKEEEKIRQHKEKCRQKGLLLVEKNKAIDRKNQRIVELGREHRVMTRINQFDHNNDSNKSSSSGSSNIDSGNNEMETMHSPKYQLKMNVPLASSSSLKQSSLQPSSSSYSSSLRKDALNDMPDKNDNDEDDGYDDDDDYKYEYDDDGINYDVFNDVDDVVNNDDQKEEDDDDDDDDDDCDNNMTHPFENINSINTNNINNPPISNVPPSTTTSSTASYLHSNEWKQLLLLSNEKRDIVLHTMMEKMSNAEMFQQEIPSLMTVIQEVQNNQRFEEGKKDQECKNVKEKNALDGIKGQDTLKVYNKNGETSTSSTSKASYNDVNVDTITQPLSIDKLRQYRLRHYA
jgi:hypothetical protein